MDKKTVLKYWAQVRALTLKLIDEFPANSFDYRPAEEIMTVSQLFRHILQVEIFFRTGIIEGTWDQPHELGTSMFEKDMIKNRLESEMAKTQKLLMEVPDGKFISKIKTPKGSLSGGILIMIAIDEEIHHRGNLYTYLRCLGITPPQMIQQYEKIQEEDSNVR